MSGSSTEAKRALLAKLLKERAAGTREAPSAEPIPEFRALPRDRDLPLSFGQERVWFLDMLQPESAFYNHLDLIAFSGPLDVKVLRRCLDLLVARHEVLRSTFPEVDGLPVQRVGPPWSVPLPVTDLRHVSVEARNPRSREIAAQEAKMLFNLATGPLLRARLLRLADDEHLLVFTVHHIAWDGWSLGLFLQELTAAYPALASGMTPDLPELPVQYAEFADWQRRWLSGKTIESQRKFWAERLGGTVPTLELPLDRPRTTTRSFEARPLYVGVEGELLERVRELSRREGMTLYTTVLTLFNILLHRYSGQDDVLLGTLVSGRVRPEIDRAIGCFVNTIALRTDLSGDPTFQEALKRTREVVLSAHAHADYPYEELVKQIQPDRDLSRNPLLQVFLNMLNIRMWEDIKLPGGLTIRSLPTLDSHAVADGLTLFASEADDRLQLCFGYPIELFDAETIERMAGHFLTLMAEAAAHPERRISELRMIPPEEAKILQAIACNSREALPTDHSLHGLFEAQADRRPEAPALTCEGVTLSYGDLNARANRVAEELRGLGVGPDQLVGLCAERSIDLVVGLLGILKAGGAYLPLDPSYPAERLSFMIEDAGLTTILAQRTTAPLLPASRTRVVLFEDLAGSDAKSGNPVTTVQPSSLAYVIYTSGTTGRPKGVQITHANVVRLLSSTEKWFHFDASDVWTLFHSFSFDFSVWEIWGALAHGGRLVIVPHDTARDPALFRRLLARERVTVLNQTPSAFGQLIPADATEPADGLHLRYVIFGGEALELAMLRPWIARHGDRSPRLINMYGITETCVHVTYREITAGDVEGQRASPIGVPIPDLAVYLLDQHGQMVPFGLPGEVYVAGAGVARGYLNRPDLTAERFPPDPFRPGRVMYRSGDLARRRPTGELEYLGRRDEQVKIRGHRIELGEIESTLLQMPEVRGAIVQYRAGPDGSGRLVAYVVPADAANPPTLEAIQVVLRRTLPEYMVPDSFVVMETLPLTTNGKVNRSALPEPAPSVSTGSTAMPETPAERTVARIWCEVLGLERAGIHENFFALGGHSLVAARVAARLREAFQCDVPVRRLFELQTIAELAKSLEPEPKAQAGLRTYGTPVALEPSDGPPVLSFAQERLWFFEQLESGSSAYNIPTILRLRGRLDQAVLERSLTTILERHHALRSTFRSDEGKPILVIQPPSRWTVEVTDLLQLDPTQREGEGHRLANAETLRPFDLETGPLARARLIRLDEQDHLFVLTIHHIIGDGWSLQILMKELAELYRAGLEHRVAALPPLPVQYPDFAKAQRAQLSGDRLRDDLDYWKQQLDGAPAALDLPLDRARPTQQTFEGASHGRVVGANLLQRLRELSRSEDATLFMTMLAGFQILMSRLSGQNDLCVGVPVAGRNRVETENLIGLFLNTVVMRARVESTATFRDVLRQVRRSAIDAYAHQELPFDRLVEELQPTRDLSRTPMFQVLFNMASFGAPSKLALPDLEIELAQGATDTESRSKFDLTFYVWEHEGGLQLATVYNAALFSRARIEEMLEQYVLILEGLLDADQPIDRVSLVTAGAQARLPDLTVPLPAAWLGSVTERFAAHAVAEPERLAVIDPFRSWSYGELDRRANRLAAYLREQGIRPGQVVAVYAHRSAGLTWALLGILKAGAAFTIIDPSYPSAHSLSRLRAVEVRGWISVPEAGPVPDEITTYLSKVPGLITARWSVDPAAEAWAHCPDRSAAIPIGPDDLAYVVFTSGSTGGPKAIAGSHAPLSHFFDWHQRTHGLTREDRFAVLSGLAHDPLLRDILGAFWCGGTVCMPDSGRWAEPGYLAGWSEASGVTVLHLTPAMAALLSNDSAELPRRLPRVRWVGFGGEALEGAVVAALRTMAQQAGYVNFYGTSETPQAIAQYDLQPTDQALPRIPIGSGIDGVQLLVVGPNGKLAGIGEPGEIRVRTPYLSRGYLNDAALTAERFIPNPLGACPDDRIYRTGDIGAYRPDGTVEFRGRADHQVKIRGHRVELGEVQSVLAGHPAVRESIVVTNGPAADLRVIAYVVLRSGHPAPDLREYLRSRLPEYMQPASVVVLPSLPMTPNGKVDRRALPEPEPQASASSLPRTATERTIAEVWTDILGVASIGVQDNFFDLGGHSLMVTRVLSRLRTRFGIALPVRAMFESPTVESLARVAERYRSESVTQPREREEISL